MGTFRSDFGSWLRHDHAAEHAERIGEHRQQREGDGQCQQLGQHQQVHGRNADGAQRVHFGQRRGGGKADGALVSAILKKEINNILIE